jgi:hypothetical protein
MHRCDTTYATKASKPYFELKFTYFLEFCYKLTNNLLYNNDIYYLINIILVCLFVITVILGICLFYAFISSQC